MKTLLLFWTLLFSISSYSITLESYSVDDVGLAVMGGGSLTCLDNEYEEEYIVEYFGVGFTASFIRSELIESNDKQLGKVLITIPFVDDPSGYYIGSKNHLALHNGYCSAGILI